jgi:hypothetical protein
MLCLGSLAACGGGWGEPRGSCASGAPSLSLPPHPPSRFALRRTGAGERTQEPLAQGGLRLSRINPSCATEATSVPSAAKIIPRAKPRPPEEFGLSCA